MLNLIYNLGPLSFIFASIAVMLAIMFWGWFQEPTRKFQQKHM